MPFGGGGVTHKECLALITPSTPPPPHLPSPQSWSNTLDYIQPAQFHEMARACSATKDTVHFGYSMSWPCDARRSHVIDYPTRARQQLFQLGLDAWHMGCMLNGVGRLTLFPPVDNAINMCDYGLAFGANNDWLDAFFAAGRVPRAQVGNDELSQPHPIAERNGLLNFTWTYDPAIKFHGLVTH